MTSSLGSMFTARNRSVAASGMSKFQGNLRRAISYITVGFVLVFYLFPDIGRPQNYIYGLVLPLALIFAVFNYNRFPWRNKLLVATFAALTYFCLAAFWGGDSVGEQWKLFRRGFYIASFILAVWVTLDYFRSSLDGLVLGFVVVALVSATVSLGHYAVTDGANLARMSPVLIPQPLYAAGAYGVAVVTAVYLACTVSERWKMLLYAATVVPLLTAMALTQSRGPAVGMALAIAFLGLLPAVRTGRWTISMASLALAAALVFVATPVGELFLERGSSYRLEIWRSVLAEVKSDLWFGEGWFLNDEVRTNVGTFNHAHSAYMGTLRHTGVIGLAILLALIGSYFKAGLETRDQFSGLMCAWIVFGTVYMLTDIRYIVSRPDISWIAFWMPVTAICFRAYSREVTTSARAQRLRPRTPEWPRR